MSNNNEFVKRMGLANLTDDQLGDLHQATLDILDRVGVKVCSPAAVELLKRAGARVNGDLVKIPGQMIRQALDTAPGRVKVFDRSGNPAMNLEKENIYYGTGSDMPYTIDVDTGERRLSVKQDTINAAVVTDALEHLDFVMAMAKASDVPESRIDRHHFEAMTLNSTKPIIFDSHDCRGFSEIVDMASLAVGSRKNLIEKPYIIHYCQPSSPLFHTENALEKLIVSAEERIPVVYAPAVMCGATGPVTTVGSLLLANAEILSGLVVHQLTAEGAPFIYGGGTPPLNMITTVCSYGDPQGSLGSVSLVQLSHYYDLPSFTLAGCTDAQTFDQQAAMEAGINLLFTGLSGGNLIHDLGYMGAGMTGSLEYLILCDEGVGKIKYLLKGLELNPTTMALDVIERVSPGGQFLTEEHTMEHFRSQMHFTRLFNRNNYDNWQASGSKSCGEYANALLKEILQWHEVQPLDPKVDQAIKEISAGNYYGRDQLA